MALQRRAHLLEGYSHALRLPDQAILPGTLGPNQSTDGVFRVIMSLPKGRTMLARALPLLCDLPFCLWVSSLLLHLCTLGMHAREHAKAGVAF